MKRGILLVIIVVFSLSLVSATLSVPCSSDQACSVSLGGGYSCVERSCAKQVVSQAPETQLSLTPATHTLTWNLLTVEEASAQGCSQEGCLSFAPVQEKNFFQKFLSFILYVRDV